MDTPYAAVGFDATHAGLADGNENVDLFSGAVNLEYVDHVIPGSCGLPIQVLRTYSSKVMDEQEVPYDESWVGLGWELHFVRGLPELRRLLLCDDGPIASLESLTVMKNLEEFYFYESTNILDGDLSVLRGLPRLRDVAFMDRRHYSHRRAEFPQTAR